MLRRTAIPAAVATLALLASACSGGTAEKGSAGANPTLATEPPHSNPTLATVPPPTTTTNPYAVPAVIDVAYVNRVLAELDAVLGDVARLVVTTRTIPREAYDRLRAIYQSDEFLQIALDGFQLDIRDNFTGYKANLGNQRSIVSQLLTSKSNCIFARIERDYSAVGTSPSTSLSTQWISLKPLNSAQDPSHYNRTAWAYVYDGFPKSHSQPQDPCAGT